MEDMKCNTIVVGSGLAGLVTSLELSKEKEVLLITKKELKDSNSYLAQGGISICRDSTDREPFINDTLKAGHHKNTLEAVEILVDESRGAIQTLLDYGVIFNTEDGEFSYTKEGGHSRHRVLYHDDIIGEAILDALVEKILSTPNIKVIENCEMIDFLVVNNTCLGIVAKHEKKEYMIRSKKTVLASGGVGGVYKNTTNFSHIQGDGIALAILHKVKLKDISYIQFHPTSLYEKTRGRRFLLSESLRGEGALLLNHKKERFVDELQPRDIVANAILKEMEKDLSEYEWLNLKTVRQNIPTRFPTIYQYLKKTGIDPEKNYVPVTPAQHYTMGGIEVDMQGRTSMENLYAVGEVACTGVHGKNRMANNSLLECVVFGKRVAKDILSQNTEFVNYEGEFILSPRMDETAQSKLILEKIEEDKNEKAK